MRSIRFALIALAVFAAACGGGSSPGSPTQPGGGTSTPPPAANRAPSITEMSITTFGIQSLSQFAFSGSATDLDGDPLTYSWDIAGSPATGSSGSMAVGTGGSLTARLTVSDGKGATATDTRLFIVGSMTGRWTGTWGGWIFVSNLTQNGGAITGDYADQDGPGRLDPAVVNTIDANGNVKLRYKQATFTDFTFTGTMDATGRRITGVVNGAVVANIPFTMVLQ